jgi:hypothetical protein
MDTGALETHKSCMRANLARVLSIAVFIGSIGAARGQSSDAGASGRGDDFPTAISDEPTFHFNDGCTYGAIVSGWLLPDMADPETPARVRPRIAVSASLTCPKQPIVRSSEVLDGNLTMTLGQVRNWIERAAIVRSRRSCLYVPEAALGETGLRIENVTLMCPSAHGKRAARVR